MFFGQCSSVRDAAIIGKQRVFVNMYVVRARSSNSYVTVSACLQSLAGCRNICAMPSKRVAQKSCEPVPKFIQQ